MVLRFSCVINFILIFFIFVVKRVFNAKMSSCSDWICPLCTLSNSLDNERCSLCGTKNSDMYDWQVEYAGLEAVDFKNRMWRCDRCYTGNHMHGPLELGASSESCIHCGRIRSGWVCRVCSTRNPSGSACCRICEHQLGH